MYIPKAFAMLMYAYMVIQDYIWICTLHATSCHYTNPKSHVTMLV